MEVRKDTEFYPLFVAGLREIYSAENDSIGVLRELENSSTSNELAKIFKKHRAQTQEHVNRLETIHRLVGEKSERKKGETITGFTTKAREMTAQTLAGSTARDAALISSAQKIEHFEIAAYQNLVLLAQAIDQREIQEILLATLYEEKQADAELTELAVNFIQEKVSGK